MAFVLVGLYLMWITPLRLSWALRLAQPPPAVRWALRVWGVQIALPHFRARRRLPRSGLSLGALAPALRLLKRAVRIQRLEIHVLAGGDAAAAAVVTGLLRAADGLVPRVRIRCAPAWGRAGALRAKCILDARLGTLWTAALLGAFLLRRARKKEEGP